MPDFYPTRVAGFIARAYAQGRLHSTRNGDRWIDITKFAERAVAFNTHDMQSLQRLYDLMLKTGAHTYGGTLTPTQDTA